MARKHYTRPDPEIFHRAAKKVLTLGVEPSKAVFESAHELYPESHGTEGFKVEAFNWKIKHWEQYRKAFGEVAQPTFKFDRSKLPAKIRDAQRILEVASLEMMANICAGRHQAV